MCFKNGRESLEDDPRGGRPFTIINVENVERIGVLLAVNRRLSIKMFKKKNKEKIESEGLDQIVHLYQSGEWFLLHDNAFAHSSLIVAQGFFVRNCFG